METNKTADILEIIQRNYKEFKGTNEAELHSSEEIADIISTLQKELEETKAKLQVAEREQLPENISDFIYEMHRMRGLYMNKKYALAANLRSELANKLFDIMES